MANLFVILVIFCLLHSLVAVKAQLLSQNISIGTKLFPNSYPSSWLSPSGLFGFGFYPKGNGYAVGIWLIGTPTNTTVWTANRDDPPISSNAYLWFTRQGWLLTTPDTQKKSMQNSKTNSLLRFQPLCGQYLPSGTELVSSFSSSDQSSGRFGLVVEDYFLAAYPINSKNILYWTFAATGLNDSSEWLNFTDEGLVLNNRNETAAIHRATLDADGNFRIYSHRFRNSSNNQTISVEWSGFENPCQASGFCGVNSFCSRSGGTANCTCFPGFNYIDPNMAFLGCYRDFVNHGFCWQNLQELTYNFTIMKGIMLGGHPYSEFSAVDWDCQNACLVDCNCWAVLYSTEGDCKKYKLPLLYASVDGSPSTNFTLVHRTMDLSALTHEHPKREIRNKSKRRRLIAIIGLSLGLLAFLFTLFAIFSFFLFRKGVQQYHKLLEIKNLGLNKEFTLRSFSYNELERATDGFKDELSSTSFGKVYRGTLLEDSKIVAVKRQENCEQEGGRDFIAEMTAIGRIYHRNVIQLLGFCLEGTKKLLVYEFMSKGSLADVLFQEETRPTWEQRKKLALDVALGISYLHEECEPCIVHCSIRPQNIQVNNSWTAKLCNFETARLLMPTQNGILSAVDRAVRGYLAPEWQNNALTSEKIDVYSYGIVLLEIICCRSNVDNTVSTPDEVELASWAYKCLVTNELKKLIRDEEIELMSLERFLKVGFLCIQEAPHLRPSMRNVILMLEGRMEIPSTLPKP
ncbi:G-type lectin S-receptor-like serine/threonine-protein kinase LECRK1 [Coffea arabica]|uniref:non-specific serine/threonine protein kinase n=1 Tax=Coffea arabica TaxID=13443 RepID=A0ABM4V303_COFAR